MSVLLPADPKANFLAHADQIRAAIERVLVSGHYILGPEVDAFEREFAAYQGGGHLISVANGTEALEIALRALGVGPGDLVATVGNTVTATVSAIHQIGARPIFVEIERDTMLMDPAALEATLARLAGQVKAVVPVHLYGQTADLPRIVEVAARHGAKVLEDCAQAHGARSHGRLAGAWGDLAAFSFYPTKNLGALGDGGAVFTRDASLAERVRLLRQYGWRTRYVAEIPGRNSRLDVLQAAILRVKLTALESENERRRTLAARYRERLAAAPVSLPVVADHAVPVYHQFVVRVAKREALRAHLQANDIVCGVLYPVPVYRQPAYADPAVNLPQTDLACEEVLCLPCHPGLTTGDVDRVADEILRWRHPA
jgi:aminotransferase EvaB